MCSPYVRHSILIFNGVLRLREGRAQAEGSEHAKVRHLTQQASIIGNMLRRQLFQPVAGQPLTVVEFGAGKGMLMDEGALSFVTALGCPCRDSPYKQARQRENDRAPSSQAC